MEKIRFYMENDGRWYVDLPKWQGKKADLEMVEGADVMLNYMSEGNNEVYLLISKDKFEGANELEMIRMADEIGNGAYYKLEKYNGIDINLEIWLCDVTEFVFGDFPKNIYISTIND